VRAFLMKKTTCLISAYTLLLSCSLISTTCIAQLQTDSTVTKKTSVFKTRITAALLDLTMGPLGAHRIYLGCAPHVPVAYVATVGGGVGLLPVLDFFAILFTKDLSKLQNNNRVFMWLKKDEEVQEEEAIK
jgi:TM2 domain-containing membrane protein YozV